MRTTTFATRPGSLRVHRRLAAVLATAIFFAAALLGGCRREPKAAGETATGTPHRGGTVVTGWPSEPGGVNPLILPASQPTSEMLFRLFLHLLEEQSDFDKHPPTFKPELARSYEWSADHKTLTFHLRDDAVWSDGVPVTADDVRWTWQAQISKDVVWEGAESKQSITDVEAVDPHTVRFHFSRVYAKQLLDANEGSVLPKHVWEKLPFAQWRKSGDWFKQHLVVDGPFTIGSWQPQQQVVLQRNERYYEKGFPRLDRVVMRIVPSQSAGLTQLLNGEIDFLPQIAVGDVKRAQAAPQVQLIALWFNIYVAVGWNNENPLFQDPQVRRALTLGIDRKTIVETLLGPYGRVADSPVLTMVWAHDRSLAPLPYDPAEAKRILAAKGWKDTDGDGVLDKGGKPFSFELITNAGNQLRTDAIVMIQDQLKKIGVKAVPRQVEFNTMASQTRDGSFEAVVIGFAMDTSLDMTGNYHSKSIADGSNFVRFRNPEMDHLLEVAESQPDVLAERPYLDQIQQLVHREQPVTFLWESQRLTAVNKRVKDVRPTLASSFFNLKEWWVEPKP
ncbi:MAG TPA: ABC transporter substrate-binding protein [Thermoanaerobaculia bacterium]|nr:ABC transporter substrate-binding protein [Thermoanaerobaculia bacterium]